MAMDEKKIARINELARKAKSAEGLTEAEKQERQQLREEYVAAFRGNLRSTLDNVVVVNPDGSRHKLERKPGSGHRS